MKLINPITANIVDKARDGDSIRNVARKTGFAYSAVYRWVKGLEAFGVLDLKKEGNKTVVSVNKGLIYRKFIELSDALEIGEKDSVFWKFMRKTRLDARFVKGTAAVIWTKGGYVTGDFFDKVYHVEVSHKDSRRFEQELEKMGINYGKGETVPENKRPFISIKIRKKIKIERKDELPVMPLKEFILWCKKLDLEPILEQLDLLYNLELKVKYSEVRTNV